MPALEITDQATEATIDTTNDYLLLVDVSETPDAINKVTPAALYTAMIGNVKRYVALLTQTSTNAPVATVLENSLGGTLVWAYSATGTYTATLAGAFPINKAVILTGPSELDFLYQSQAVRLSDNAVLLQSWSLDTLAAADDLLDHTPISITVYP